MMGVEFAGGIGQSCLRSTADIEASETLHIDCWVKLLLGPGIVATTRYVASQQSSSSIGWELFYEYVGTDRKFSFCRYNIYGSAGRQARSTVVIQSGYQYGTWHHIGCGYDGTNSYISVDGETRVTAALGAAAKSVTGPLYIGGHLFGPSLAGILDGAVGSFAMFGDYITQAQSEQMRAGGNIVNYLPTCFMEPFNVADASGNYFLFNGPGGVTYQSTGAGAYREWDLHSNDPTTRLLLEQWPKTFTPPIGPPVALDPPTYYNVPAATLGAA